ncbi:MAG: sensor histidine kinase, partial [Gammaproteobacteria bacterium]|nr:sensor histidine kinase [Gammaproteobacteria bacterium]
MLNSLVTKLIGLFITLMIIILMVFTWYVSKSSLQNQLQMTQALHQDLAKNMIKENHLLRDGKIDPSVLEHVFHSMMLLGPAFEIYVVDLTGKILAFSAVEGKVKRKVVNLTPIKSFLNQHKKWPLLGDDPRHQSRQKIFSAAKIYQVNKANADDK